MNEHIRLAIAALQHLKDEVTHHAAQAFRESPELLVQFGDATDTMERLQAELLKIDSAIAYLRGLEG